MGVEQPGNDHAGYSASSGRRGGGLICQGQCDGGTGDLAGKVTTLAAICRRSCCGHLAAGVVAEVMTLAVCMVLRGCIATDGCRGGGLTALMLPCREATRQDQYQR